MRAALRLLKSVFPTNAFSLEAGTIQGAGMAMSAMPAADESFAPLAAWACHKCDAPVTVKQLPANMVRRGAQDFFREVEPFLKSDRAHLVFDLSEVACLDSAGVDALLRCLQEASSRDGDLKLAGVSAELGAILEWTKAGRLFEVFESASDAVHSFHQQLKRDA
jgi:anti-sigma B factor antagonist